MAVLGFAEVGPLGECQCPQLQQPYGGSGGFIDITQNVKKFPASLEPFTAGKQTVKMKGMASPFTPRAPRKSSCTRWRPLPSGRRLCARGRKFSTSQNGRYFVWSREGLDSWWRAAHGVDLQRDILDQMEFKPVIPEYVRYMDPRLFREGPMGLTPEQMEMLDPEYESLAGPPARWRGRREPRMRMSHYAAGNSTQTISCGVCVPCPKAKAAAALCFVEWRFFGAAAGWPVVSAYLRELQDRVVVLPSLPH